MKNETVYLEWVQAQRTKGTIVKKGQRTLLSVQKNFKACSGKKISTTSGYLHWNYHSRWYY
ncbi:MAG: hypothetical protein RR444_03855 [Oscillospiraceae bacterium]